MSKIVTITTDPIADMLTRIRNSIAVGKSEISLPHSNLKEKVAKMLAEHGYLAAVKTDTIDNRKVLIVSIYAEGESAKINEIKRLSRPGRRQYVKAAEIPRVKNGRGIVIISTSKGIMTGEQAKNQSVGGELICQVY